MPYQIVKNRQLPGAVDGMVQPVYPEKPGTIFGNRVGSVSAAVGSGGVTLLQVVCPSRNHGSSADTKALMACYRRCLKQAAARNMQALALPLLAGSAQGFPQEWVLRLAVDAVCSFLEDHEMQIYLLVPEDMAFGLPAQKRAALEAYLASRNTPPVSLGVSFPPQVAEDCCMAAPSPAYSKKSSGVKNPGLEEWLGHPDAGFTETLLALIDKTGKKDSQIYSKANVSRQHFSKIRNNPHYKPTKPTAIAFAIALELDLEQTKDLIGRAGYALTSSSIFDLIIMYFIEKRNYDLFEINEALFEFDQNLLGA